MADENKIILKPAAFYSYTNEKSINVKPAAFYSYTSEKSINVKPTIFYTFSENNGEAFNLYVDTNRKLKGLYNLNIDTKKTTTTGYNIKSDTSRTLQIGYNINFDTKRNIQANYVLNADTNRTLQIGYNINLDTKRSVTRAAISYDLNADTNRLLQANYALNADTKRNVKGLYTINGDTKTTTKADYNIFADTSRKLAKADKISFDLCFDSWRHGYKSSNNQTTALFLNVGYGENINFSAAENSYITVMANEPFNVKTIYNNYNYNDVEGISFFTNSEYNYFLMPNYHYRMTFKFDSYFCGASSFSILGVNMDKNINILIDDTGKITVSYLGKDYDVTTKIDINTTCSICLVINSSILYLYMNGNEIYKNDSMIDMYKITGFLYPDNCYLSNVYFYSEYITDLKEKLCNIKIMDISGKPDTTYTDMVLDTDTGYYKGTRLLNTFDLDKISTKYPDSSKYQCFDILTCTGTAYTDGTGDLYTTHTDDGTKLSEVWDYKTLADVPKNYILNYNANGLCTLETYKTKKAKSAFGWEAERK